MCSQKVTSCDYLIPVICTYLRNSIRHSRTVAEITRRRMVKLHCLPVR